MIDPVSAVAGAVLGGVGGEIYEKARGKAGEAAGEPQVEHGPIELQMIVDLISGIEKAIHTAMSVTCPPKFVPKTLPATENSAWEYKRQGYKHISLWLTAAATLNVRSQTGLVVLNPAVGWNAFDLPDNSMVWVPAGALNVLLYFGDEKLDITGV